MGVASMALRERPVLSPAICRDGGASLREYIASHREDLARKVELVQAEALEAQNSTALRRDFQLSWPLTRACWLAWIQENRARFEDVLRDMRHGARSSVNEQLRPLGDVPDSAPKMAPQEKRPQPPWAKLVRNGWYALKLKSPDALAAAAPARQEVENQVVLLVVSAGNEKAAYRPASLRGQGFEVPRNVDLAQGLKPLWEVAPALFLTGKVDVFRLRMKAVLAKTKTIG